LKIMRAMAGQFTAYGGRHARTQRLQCLLQPRGCSPVFMPLCRGFGNSFDPYKSLCVDRSASDEEIKKAYKKQALATHPDRNPDLEPEEAQNRFTEVGSAYEILKDPQKRQEYDQTGRVGGNPNTVNQADAERHFREFIMQQQMFHEQMMRQHRPKVFPDVDMEARIRNDVDAIHQASRVSNISHDNDDRRATYAGKLATIQKVDPDDNSVKLRVMISPRQADELWYGAGAIWDPKAVEEDLEVRISPEVEAIHEASRHSGIGEENDSRRARCSGKLGTVVRVDHDDGSAKVRVVVLPGRADELWFGMAAFEPLPEQYGH